MSLDTARMEGKDDDKRECACGEINYSVEDADAFMRDFDCERILKGNELKVFVASPEEPLLDIPNNPLKAPSPQKRSASNADMEKRTERLQRKLNETQDAHELGNNALAMMTDHTAHKVDPINANIARNRKTIGDEAAQKRGSITLLGGGSEVSEELHNDSDNELISPEARKISRQLDELTSPELSPFLSPVPRKRLVQTSKQLAILEQVKFEQTCEVAKRCESE